MPFVGFQAGHRGQKLCCRAIDKKMDVKKFWDSQYLKDVRESMLAGEKLEECHACYVDEEQGKFSLRNHYNTRYKDFPTLATPTAMDLDFSNLCNLQCIMCGPDRSSQWSKELGDKTVITFPKTQIDDLCAISHNVKHLNIQGGEPSLMPEFEYYFTYLKENKLIQEIDLDCISNLTNINNKFYDLLTYFKSATVNASIDAYGPTNDYIRFPSNFKKIEKNLRALAGKQIQVNLQITIQALTMYNFNEFLTWITKVQGEFKQKGKPLGINITYVTNPECLDITNTPKKLKQKMLLDIEQFNFEPKQDIKFTIGVKNIKKILENTLENQHDDKLKQYISLLDRRRNIRIYDFIPDFFNYQ